MIMECLGIIAWTELHFC